MPRFAPSRLVSWSCFAALAALVAVVSLCVTGVHSRAEAQCSSWLPGPLAAPSIGADGEVNAMTVWNDGTQNVLVIGGSFTHVDGVPANYLAQWDGVSWRAVDGGPIGPVFALTVWNNELVAGGYRTFTTSSAKAAYVQADAGGGWFTLGGALSLSSSSAVNALTVYNGTVYAGGSFNDPTHNLAFEMGNLVRWDAPSSTWMRLGRGTNGPVNALCATSIGLLPMALKLGAGSEAYAPLARAILGGLAVSVVLTVFLVPAAYVLVYGRKAAVS